MNADGKLWAIHECRWDAKYWLTTFVTCAAKCPTPHPLDVSSYIVSRCYIQPQPLSVMKDGWLKRKKLINVCVCVCVRV